MRSRKEFSPLSKLDDRKKKEQFINSNRNDLHGFSWKRGRRKNNNSFIVFKGHLMNVFNDLCTSEWVKVGPAENNESSRKVRTKIDPKLFLRLSEKWEFDWGKFQCVRVHTDKSHTKKLALYLHDNEYAGKRKKTITKHNWITLPVIVVCCFSTA